MALNRHKRSPKNRLLNQIFPDWDNGGGIFSVLATNTIAPPWGELVSSTGLDIYYHGEHSGEKFVSPICYNWIDEDGILTEIGKDRLSVAVQAKYYQKWRHLWELYISEYNPLDTYNITDSETRSLSSTGSEAATRTPDLTKKDTLQQNDTDSHTTNGSVTHGESVNTVTESTNKVNDQVWGFNGEDPVDKTQTLTESNSEATETHSGIDSNTSTTSGTNSRTASNTHTETGSETNNVQRSGSESETISRTRSGNMYRSPSELLSFDREFWMEDFFTIVFRDVDILLTLDIYSESPVNYTVF